MSESKKLSQRQLAVLDDLFAGKLKQPEALEKHHVSPSLFQRWQMEKQFVAEFERRIVCAHRQSRLVLAQNTAAAADKLVELMNSQSPETARRACLDILALHNWAGQQESPVRAPDPVTRLSAQTLSPEIASRLLAALAREEPSTGRESV